MYHRAFALIVVALLMLAGCGGEQIDAQKLALESADAFQTADTFHFQMTVSQGKPAPIDTPLGGLALLSAEGDFKQPQMLRGSLKAQLSDVPLPISINAIIIGDEAYLTNPLDPTRWEKVEDSQALSSFSPAQGVSAVLSGLQNPQAQGRETIEGVETHHIVGSANAAVLQPLIGGPVPEGTLQIEVWIGAVDKLPRRIVAVGPLDPSEPEDIKRTLVLSDFGKDVTIERPE